MRIITHRALVLFYEKYPDAKASLEMWYETASDASWDSFAQMKQCFNSVDNVGNQRYVFNVKGNNYRIVAVVKFKIKMIYIRFVGSHSQYEKVDVKNI